MVVVDGVVIIRVIGRTLSYSRTPPAPTRGTRRADTYLRSLPPRVVVAQGGIFRKLWRGNRLRRVWRHAPGGNVPRAPAPAARHDATRPPRRGGRRLAGPRLLLHDALDPLAPTVGVRPLG